MERPDVIVNTNIDDDALLGRALAAYFLRPHHHGEQLQQPSQVNSGVEEIDRKTYVVLRSGRDLLKVYRVSDSGILKGIKRPPKELRA
jgi:hypothetical protein